MFFIRNFNLRCNVFGMRLTLFKLIKLGSSVGRHLNLKSGKKCLDPNLQNEITRSILKINKRFIAHFNQ